MDRRSFCLGVLSLPAAASAAQFRTHNSLLSTAICNEHREVRLVLEDLLEHPFYWWPRTLLSYPIEFCTPVDLGRMILTRVDTGDRIPIQFSGIQRDAAGVKAATLHFFSDLPSGTKREFVLSSAGTTSTDQPQVKESREGNTIVLDSGLVRVRIPTSQTVTGDAPGPILQVSRGSAWIGSSTLSIADDKITRITATRVADGPLFIAYELVYETQAGSRYIATVQCESGLDFVRFKENMEGMKPNAQGLFASTWSEFGVTHRQAPNHPYPTSGKIRDYDEYPWETIDEPWPMYPEPLANGELPFDLGIYETWTAFRTGTFANFWDRHSDDALGVFIDKAGEWQDHQYTNHVESPMLRVRYFYRDGKLSWEWPIARGSRSTCIAFYDHQKDKEAMHQVEKAALGVKQDGLIYAVGLIYVSHVHFLQNRYGTLDLNCVKDWVLAYSENAKRPPVLFLTGQIKDVDELEERVIAGPFACTLPINGTRQNGGAKVDSGALSMPGRSIVSFSPVPSRQVQAWWVDGFNRFASSMNTNQRKRLTAMYLFMAYVHAGEEFMPLVPMLSGHPNFLADVKAVPAAMSFLFPEHPMAAAWADLWQKYVEINTRYNTRPDVHTWNAHGGRWTENLGTYVWAFLRPSVRSDYLLRQFDAVERFVSPQLAEMAEWLVNALSAPFDGETEEAYKVLQTLDAGHEWGALAPGSQPRRIHPPQGAHSERRVPPRSMWYLGTCLMRYAPLAAEYAMWAARPTDQDMETKPGKPDAWDVVYRTTDNRGTNPHLRSRKYTGYGIVMRSAVDTPDEVSVHLQQIDEGPNYRWGRAGEGGCGVIYYFAAGKAYSFNGSEDVGDRDDGDTDFCTNFGVYKDGEFRSIGENALSRPFYNLGAGQYAELVPREEPGAYAWPEYASRSVLMAGNDYFVVYDAVLGPMVTHRFSWFVRRGSELPTIQLLRGAKGDIRDTQRTEIQTDATTGFWMDGVGDSMALVSHRKDIQSEGTRYGCRVRAAEIDDFVFRNPAPVKFEDGSTLFNGTAGLIRLGKDKSEFALFHGTRIGVAGLIVEANDTDLGIGGVIAPGQSLRGSYYAPKPNQIRITLPSASDKTVLYIDGDAQTTNRRGNTLVIDLKEGQHEWELSDTLPVPQAPRIERTENIAGGARVLIAPCAGASRYRLELSKDGGEAWSVVTVSDKTESAVTGLQDGEKVHVRAIALNGVHESTPGPEYPVYVTKDTPLPPDGLHVDLADGAATVTWGEVLGVTEYRLYAKTAESRDFRLLYRGLERTYIDKKAGIQAPLLRPDPGAASGHKDLIEYCVTAVNGNGEGVRSRLANTNPASWRNWDPRPGEPFRRDFADNSPSASIRVPTTWPHYYPR
ncbi:MAG TPA: hypothetical protein VHD85_03340 [Terracidiphilus sp.]|nr:hypothetical protein [Terracidiphilus sp.]